MSIKYNVLPRKNPQDVNAPAKFYAASVADGTVDLDTLADRIAYQTSLTDVDCYAVIHSLVHNVMEELKQGRIVRLGKLGTFQISISSKGMDNASEVSSDSITNSRIIFRPGSKLKEMLTKLKYKKRT